MTIVMTWLLWYRVQVYFRTWQWQYFDTLVLVSRTTREGFLDLMGKVQLMEKCI